MQLTKSNLSLPPHTCPPQLSYLKYFPFLQKIQVKVDSCPRVMGLAECLALRAGTVAPAPSSVRPNVPLICDMGRDGARVVRVKRIPGVKAWPFCGAQDTPPPPSPPLPEGTCACPERRRYWGKGARSHRTQRPCRARLCQGDGSVSTDAQALGTQGARPCRRVIMFPAHISACALGGEFGKYRRTQNNLKITPFVASNCQCTCAPSQFSEHGWVKTEVTTTSDL